MDKKIILKIARILVGGFFIFSGITKLFPIEIFEIQFVFGNGIPWIMTPIFSRLLISLEVALGTLMILNVWTKKVVIPFSIILLLGFTSFLIYQLIIHGNQENCACFGSVLPFNTSESIIKNFILLGVIYVIHENNEWISRLKSLSIMVYIIFTIILFLLYPVPDIRNYNQPTKHPQNLEANFLKKFNQPQLQEGKHLVLFLGTTCIHCKSLAKQLALIRKVKKITPVHIFFLENRKKSPEFFFKETNSDFPYTILTAKDFFPITEGKVPHIMLVSDNKIIKIFSSKSFNPDEIDY